MIFIGRRRPGFDMEWGKAMEARVHAEMKKMGLNVFSPAEKPVDDNSFRKAIADCKAAGVESLVIGQGTMGDGRLALTLAQLWQGTPILWATPEKQEGDMISSCSLVGLHAWATSLHQIGRRVEVITGAPEAPETQRRLCEATRMAATMCRLRKVRLGLIGGQAPGYFAMSADPATLYHGLGVQMQTFSMIEFANVLNDISKDAIAQDVEKVKAMKIPYKDTAEEDLPMASRIYLTMKHFLDNEGLDAMTVRCWPEMGATFGQWPYLGIARLVEEGRAVACEGDADGALSGWIGESLGLGRCYLSDWLESDGNNITLWHGGAAPVSMCDPIGTPGGPKLARHYNIKKPMVLDANLREMPITVMRFWRCDGSYFVTSRDGQMLKPKRPFMGSNGLGKLDNQNAGEWFETLCHAGMPHHVCVFEGKHSAMIQRMARLMNIQFI